jgi:hypothetical protein
MHRLSRAAEYKDNETGHHVIRVGEIAAVLARALGLDDDRCANLRDCAPALHRARSGCPTRSPQPGQARPGDGDMQSTRMFGCEILGQLTSKEEANATARTGAKDPDGNELRNLSRSWPCCTMNAGRDSYPSAWRVVHPAGGAICRGRHLRTPWPVNVRTRRPSRDKCLAIIKRVREATSSPVVDSFFKIPSGSGLRLLWKD